MAVRLGGNPKSLGMKTDFGPTNSLLYFSVAGIVSLGCGARIEEFQGLYYWRIKRESPLKYTFRSKIVGANCS